MHILFFLCISGAVAAVPVHFLSVEHRKLRARYGKGKGAKIGGALGVLSGYLLFFSLIGVWLSPQPRFVIPVLPNSRVAIPAFNFSVPLIHLIASVLFILPGTWLLIDSVRALSIKVSESHRPEKVVAAGVYAAVRHPQYLGWLSVHLGASFLLSARYSLVCTPFVAGLLYLLAAKEEKELSGEFGEDYEEYKRKVPMLVPGFRKKQD